MNINRTAFFSSILHVLPHCLLVFIVSVGVNAAEVGRWDAVDPSRAKGIRLEQTAGSEWRVEEIEGHKVARIKPSSDYYTRAAYHLSFEGRPAAPVWLVIEYLDRGYGLITLNPALPELKQAGVARVNSGRLRRAVLRYDDSLPPGKLRVEGLDYLRAVWLTDAAPALEAAPLVEPAVKFAVSSERVTTAALDAGDPSQLDEVLAGLRNHLPLVCALGFNGVETYVRWGMAERQRGVYNWSFYDAVVNEIEKHGLKWFPMLLAGSGYALPAWLHDSKDNVGFKCLEHGIVHDTQTIFQPFQADYASRFIAEFGKHYGKRQSLLGIRLGPSGDFGEAQYPAKGPGYQFRRDGHTHIGYWAGDKYAQAAFREHLRRQYGDVRKLDAAWGTRHRSFSDVKPFLPETAVSRRQRLDFANWYMGAMSDWCEHWAEWSRQALPHTSIHMSSGGWGPVQIGTDFTAHAKIMSKVGGGLRLTNEGDDFPDNFTITRMASSAARFYGAPLGYEPGGFGTKRGVLARLFNAVTTDAVHLFYYIGNLTGNDQALDAWLKYAPLLDQRAKPVIDVAALYPDTALKLDDEVVRYRWGSTFYSVGRTLREEVDFDYVSEPMVLDGALDRYRVLLFLWGAVLEQPVLERIDRWVRQGGTLVFAASPRVFPATVEGDASLAGKWLAGDTGSGRVVLWRGDLIPSRSYAEFVKGLLLETPSIRPAVRAALQMEKPTSVFWSVLENGQVALLNFSNRPATVRLTSGKAVTIPPYEMAMERAP